MSVRELPPWLSGRLFNSHAGYRGSNPGRDTPKSIKQVVTIPLSSAWQQERVSRVFGDDYCINR